MSKLLTVCLCGCCPGRLVSFVFDGGSAAEAGVDAAAVVEVFDPGGDPGVDLVAYGEGAPVVVLGCEGGPQGFGHPPSSPRAARTHRGGKRLLVGSAMTENSASPSPQTVSDGSWRPSLLFRTQPAKTPYRAASSADRSGPRTAFHAALPRGGRCGPRRSPRA